MSGRRRALNCPHTTLPTLALIPLLLSCVGSYWASEGAKKNDRRGMLTGMILNVALAIALPRAALC